MTVALNADGSNHHVDIEAVMDLSDIITSLQDLSDDELRLKGLAVEGTLDEIDDPVLLGPNGTPVDTWREGYPYTERLTRHEYELNKRLLQIELLKVQNWVKDTGARVIMVFEGRDAAGKGGTIKRFMEHLNPRGARVVALNKPTIEESTQWYFQRYIKHLPTAGEIVLFDRSWYNRAGVERVMDFCTDAQYELFMRQAPEFERMLVDDGVLLFKFWFSVSRKEQVTRFTIRRIDPVRQWKLSPMDLASLDRWDDYSRAKQAMIDNTDTPWAPWTVVRSNDKKRGRIETMRWVLANLSYPGKNERIVGTPDPYIVGPPAIVYEHGEQANETDPAE
ncbi:MAG: polyphosphate kinase 2 [Candidatus Nanopelagicales bacterium]|nr:polyphosphate kinase 2 [Candidatus Nanopelagicales bacterium]